MATNFPVILPSERPYTLLDAIYPSDATACRSWFAVTGYLDEGIDLWYPAIDNYLAIHELC